MKRKKEEKAQKVAMKEAKQREKEALQQAKQREKEALQQAKEQEKARQREARGNKRRVDNISTRPKRKRTSDNVDSEIDNNRCCTCFGIYSDDAGTDRQWVMCSCNRWIHEDCVDSADVVDDTGKLCPLC